MTDTQRTTIFDIASKIDKTVLLLDKCSRSVVKRSRFGVRCAYGTTQTYYFPSTFAQSQFCLIAKTERLFQLNLIEALASNCIPVIFADNIVLPFNEVCRREKIAFFRRDWVCLQMQFCVRNPCFVSRTVVLCPKPLFCVQNPRFISRIPIFISNFVVLIFPNR